MLSLKETAGQRLTRAGRRPQTQEEKGRQQGHHTERRGVGLYKSGAGAEDPRTRSVTETAGLAAEFA